MRKAQSHMATAAFKSSAKPKSVTAFFHVAFGQQSIDAENGILKGVKLMELGKVATFGGEDGKPKSVKITDAHIDALLSHAGNRALPIHETHEWFFAQGGKNADSTERAARIGSLKSFRKDGEGNLIADAYLNLARKEAVDLLWGAEHNPEDNCFSVVFNYLPDDPQCMPVNFRAADIVPQGAATTALFSDATSEPKSMDINELITALADPKVQEAVKAIIKSHQSDADTADEAPAAEMEAAADVKDEDKKPEDDQRPALMRAAIRVGRAIRRQAAELKASKTAILAEAKVQAGAEATALLGKGGYIQQGVNNNPGDELETAIAAQLSAGAKDLPTAIFRIAKDKPEIYNAARVAGKI